MRHPVLRIIGFLFIGLSFAGLMLNALLAARKGQAFTGANVYGLAIPTYCVLAVVAAALLAGCFNLIRWVWLLLVVPKSSDPSQGGTDNIIGHTARARIRTTVATAVRRSFLARLMRSN